MFNIFICTMQYTTLRINTMLHKKLKEISLKAKISQQHVLEDSLNLFQEKMFWQECNAAYSILQQNSEQWQEELEERKLWEQTSSDGLELNNEH